MPRPTQAVIDLDALAHNFHAMKEFIGREVKCLAVVKADAYGHGSTRCARRLEAEGIDWFGVAIPEEGAELRRSGISSPILSLGSFWAGQEAMLIENDLTPVIFSLDKAKALNDVASEKGIRVKVHVKIDTGMGRIGIPADDATAFAAEMATLSSLTVTGLLTHFAAADDPAEDNFTELQIRRFSEICDAFRSAGHRLEITDLANSPGAIAHPNSRSGLVRLGGALYGLLDDILPTSIDQPRLQPVLALRSRIAQLKTVAEGETLGYGRTFRTSRPSVIASVPIGYADGYPRVASNRGEASLRGQSVPIVGRISMDWTLFDVTDVPGVEVGDEIYLIGGDGERRVAAAEIAALAGTIGYEITCGISPRVERVFIDSGSAGG